MVHEASADENHENAAVDALIRYGEELFSRGEVAQAARYFEQLLSEYGNSATIRNNLGVAYWQAGRTADALDQFVAALEIDRDRRESYVNLAHVLLSIDKGAEAAGIIRRYLTRHPDDQELGRLCSLCDAQTGSPIRTQSLAEPELEGLPQPPEEAPNGPIRVGVFTSEPKEWAGVYLRLLGPLGYGANDIEVLWGSASAGNSYRYKKNIIEESDIIVVQRLFPCAETRRLCAEILRSGKPVVYEIDDNLLDVPDSHPRRSVIAGATPYILEFISHADLVTVTTPQLAQRLAPYNKAVSVLPNSLDTRVWDADRCDGSAHAPDGVVTIGYAGTPTHGEDLDLIEGALRRIKEKYGSRVAFWFFGCAPASFTDKAGVHVELFQLNYGRYASRLQESRLDIALAPLVDNEFNRCKSDIKWLEYSACGYPGVYSDLPVYKNSVKNGKTGLLVENSEDAWFEAIDRLVSDADLRRRLGKAAQTEVFGTRSVATVQADYLARYTDLLSPDRRVVGDRLPISAEYEIWKRRHRLTATGMALWEERSRKNAADCSVELIVYGDSAKGCRLQETLDSIDQQIYRNVLVTVIGNEPPKTTSTTTPVRWEQGGDHPLIDRVNQALRQSKARWVGFIEAGDCLAKDAVAACVAYTALYKQWHVLYTDHDFLASNGHRCAPLFKPDMNVELLRSTPYVGHFCFARRQEIVSSGGIDALGALVGADLVLKLLEKWGASGVGHVPRVLYHRALSNVSLVCTEETSNKHKELVRAHLLRLGTKAMVEDGPIAETVSIRYQHVGQPRVSIVVPTRDRVELLRNCIESVLRNSEYSNFEVIVVDNCSEEKETLDYLETLNGRDGRVRVLRYPHEFNFSAINNEAARYASGEYLLLLNNDTVVLQKDWLTRLMEHGARPDVGIVGARLLFAERSVQHAGVIVGMSGAADHVGYGSALESPGYMCRAQLDQDFSAVTGACLLIRKDRYFEVGGLDEERFRVLFNDIDLCLKVRAAGYRVVWTPRVTLLHHESVSLGSGKNSKKRHRARVEVESMSDKWMSVLAGDPAYNINLGLSERNWTLETEVDVPWDANFHDLPRVMGLGGGSEGVREHRMGIPLKAMEEAGLAQYAVVPVFRDRIRVPTAVELARVQPDTVLAHNAVHDGQLEALQTYRRLTNAFLVFGQDDLMFDLPRTNPFYNTVFKDIKRRLRAALSSCHRLVVTTEVLADAYRSYADDIVVVPNYLSRAVWGGLRSRRRRGGKPRVGWAGAQQHAGDLRILKQVIKATAKEVDWVFFGMSLREFRRYRKELHDPVAFEEYPQALARLDLDLAVAPLERNRFNEAKSNLRLLEYGALGWPVVCSDIEPYKGAPVCRVSNNPKAWINAIRERIYDLDAAEREGDKLRQWVLDGWMLDDHLDEWLTALSPTSDVASGRSTVNHLKRVGAG